MAFVGLILRDAKVNGTRCDVLRGSRRTLVTCRFACPQVRVSSLITSPGDSKPVKVPFCQLGWPFSSAASTCVQWQGGDVAGVSQSTSRAALPSPTSFPQTMFWGRKTCSAHPFPFFFTVLSTLTPERFLFSE